jgi:HD-GYP domain-containing protein (c-di-GMP phosphodiesterase class II)
MQVQRRLKLLRHELEGNFMSYRKISVREVKLGMFIRLDLGWLEHPFLRSEFKLTAPRDLETLKGLGAKEIEYDPEKSDLETETSKEEHTKSLLAEDPATSSALGTPQDSEQNGKEIRTVRREEIQLLNQRKMKLVKSEQEYMQAFSRVKNIMKLIEPDKETAVEAAHELIDNVVETVLRDEETIVHLIALYEKDSLAYFHSLNVAILSVILGKKLDFSGKDLNELGMSAIFHDIGKQRIPKKILLKKEDLTKAEQKYLELHPRYGFSMLTGSSRISPQVLAGVLEHHERCTGKGYPQGLTESQISTYAKIIAIVDTYANLSNQDIQGRFFTPHETLSYMYTKLSSSFSQEILSVFIKGLGVYPPGTLVQLSDKSFGMVLATNRNQSLRPTLVLYDKNTPREEPVIVNLSEDRDLNIMRSLRPSETSEEVVSYLQQGKMLGFFVGLFGAGERTPPSAALH